jgi:hypothetical protein
MVRMSHIFELVDSAKKGVKNWQGHIEEKNEVHHFQTKNVQCVEIRAAFNSISSDGRMHHTPNLCYIM